MESNFTVISNNLLCLSFYRVFRFIFIKKKKIKICCANHSFLKTINSIKTRKPTIIGRTRFRVFFSFFFLKRVRYWILENYVHIHKITFEKFVHFPVYFTIYILWVISIFDVKNIIKGGKKKIVDDLDRLIGLEIIVRKNRSFEIFNNF